MGKLIQATCVSAPPQLHQPHPRWIALAAVVSSLQLQQLRKTITSPAPRPHVFVAVAWFSRTSLRIGSRLMSSPIHGLPTSEPTNLKPSFSTYSSMTSRARSVCEVLHLLGFPDMRHTTSC